MEISIEWTVVKFCTEIRGTDLRAQICPAPLPFRQIPLRPGLWRVGLIRCHTFGCSDWLQVYPTAFRGILVCACWITPLWNRKRTDRFQTNMHLRVWFHEICLLDRLVLTVMFPSGWIIIRLVVPSLTFPLASSVGQIFSLSNILIHG